MIIKEIPHKSAKARAKAENRQTARVINNLIAKAVEVNSHGSPNRSTDRAALSKQNAAAAKNIGSALKVLTNSAGVGGTNGGGRPVKAARPRSVRTTIEYAIKGDNDTQGKLIYSQKLDMLEPEMIAIAMDTTASMNQEVKNPCKHFVISWDEGEKPTRAQMTRSISQYLKYAGYEEHQAVAYLHTDTDKTHIHIIANHVHPETYKAVNRDFIRGKINHKIREKVARQLEIENGWKRVEGKHHKLDENGNLVERTYEEKILYSQTHSDKISDKSRRQESHSGKPSFERWCKQGKESDGLRRDIKKIVASKNVDWNDIHKILYKYNVGIKPDKYGKGLVVYDIQEPDKRCIAASGLSRDLSAGNLGKIIDKPYKSFVRSTELPEEALPPVTKSNLPPQQPPLTVTANPSQLATQYDTWASQVNAADPARAKLLIDAAAALRKVSNAREIALPHPSAPLNDITTALQSRGIGDRTHGR